MSFVLTTYNDVYFVTELQVIQWMQNPTGTQALRDFQEWKEKCVVKGQPFCSLPNPCPLTTRELPGETLRLHLHAVSEELSLDPGSYRRRILFLKIFFFCSKQHFFDPRAGHPSSCQSSHR